MKTVEERRLMVMDLYIQWLNQFSKPGDYQYTRKDFTPVEGEEWRTFSIDKVFESGPDEEIWVMTAGDGDDGGPAGLHVYWDNFFSDKEWELKYIIQLFDTMASIVGFEGYKDGKCGFIIDEGGRG